MSEKLTINRGYRPKLKLPKNRTPYLKSCYDALELRASTRGKPCYSLSGISSAYWETAPTDDKEIGILLQARSHKEPSLFFGVFDLADGIDLEQDAAKIAVYRAPTIDIAVNALANFLRPEPVDHSTL